MDSSWTDDIPVCSFSGVGSAPNEICRKDGRRIEMHSFEDKFFHFSMTDEGVSLYGVLDGFAGTAVADFAEKKLPAELLFGQVSRESSDSEIQEVLKQAFASVDREFFESISENLASRVVLKYETPSSNESTLALLDAATLTGASATIGLLVDNRLFVANVGDTVALVARQMSDGELKVIPLSVNHTPANEDEVLRLNHLQIRTESLATALAPHAYTRCLGFHKVKGGYKEVDLLINATDEPVLSVPEILGPLKIDSSHLFLLVFSRPLLTCLQEVYTSTSVEEVDVNFELCSLVRDQFLENSTVSGVAQSVVDKTIRMHRELFETTTENNSVLTTTCREDISLLIRNFNAKLGGSKTRRNKSVGPTGTVTASDQEEALGIGLNKVACTAHSTESTESSDILTKLDCQLSIDENGRVHPYVDFSHFHKEWNKFPNLQKS